MTCTKDSLISKRRSCTSRDSRLSTSDKTWVRASTVVPLSVSWFSLMFVLFSLYSYGRIWFPVRFFFIAHFGPWTKKKFEIDPFTCQKFGMLKFLAFLVRIFGNFLSHFWQIFLSKISSNLVPPPSLLISKGKALGTRLNFGHCDWNGSFTDVQGFKYILTRKLYNASFLQVIFQIGTLNRHGINERSSFN